VPTAHQGVIDAVMPAFDVLWGRRLR